MERSQTASEGRWLEDLLSNLPSSGRRAKLAMKNFFVFLAAATLPGILLWFGIARLTRKIAGFDFGRSSEYAMLIVLGLIAFFGNLLHVLDISLDGVMGSRPLVRQNALAF